MKTYNVTNMPSSIMLGRNTETGVRTIAFDCAVWLAKHPDLSISVWPTLPGHTQAYPAVTHMDGTKCIWEIKNTDTAYAGVGKVELIGISEGKKIISEDAATVIQEITTSATGEPEEPHKPWVDRVLEAIQSIGSGSGSSGANGKDGISVTHSWDGTTLTLTSASGTSSVDLKGEKGDKGDKGNDAVIDATLTQAGQAADAAKTGEAIGRLKDDLYIEETGTLLDNLDGYTGVATKISTRFFLGQVVKAGYQISDISVYLRYYTGKLIFLDLGKGWEYAYS